MSTCKFDKVLPQLTETKIEEKYDNFLHLIDPSNYNYFSTPDNEIYGVNTIL